MAKPKAQTLQQKLGFFDEDLKKPKHDEIMIWLDQNIESIVNDLYHRNNYTNQITEARNRFESIVQDLLSKLNSDLERFIKAPLEQDSKPKTSALSKIQISEDSEFQIDQLKKKIHYLENLKFPDHLDGPRISSIQKNWELPVFTNQSTNKFQVGFIDFAATFVIPYLKFTGFKFSQAETHPYKRQYYDVEESVMVDFESDGGRKTIYFEVKTEIPSLGELIRQINTYRSYVRGEYYVVCPKIPYVELLKAQNIGYIEYK